MPTRTAYNARVMGAPLLLALCIAIITVVVLLQSLIVVPPATAFVIEKLGRFDRVLRPGFQSCPRL